jgi:hypothetical protein
MLKLLLLGALALGLAGFGCARRPPDPQKAAAAAAASALGDDFRATKRDDVPLYRSGPQQMTMPDELLPKGTLARVVRTRLGYSLVQTESGQLGWIASEDLGVPTAPPAVVASDTIPPSAVNRIDALNARASAQNTPSAQAPGSSSAEANGDSAIVARYHIDDPAAGASPKPAASSTPAP